MVESTQGLICLHDGTGKLLFANEAACRAIGYRFQEIVGRNLGDLLHPSMRAILPRYLRRMRHEATAEGTTRMLTKDTKSPVFSFRSLRYEEGGESCVIVTAQDVTSRVRTERRQALQLAATQVLVDATSLSEAAPRLLEVVCKGTGWQVGELWRIDRVANVLRREAAWRAPSRRFEAFVASGSEMTVTKGHGLVGRAWQERAPVTAAGDELVKLSPRGGLARGATLHEAVAFPVESGGHVVAALAFFRRAVREVDADMAAVLVGVGTQVGHFLESLEGTDNGWPEGGFVSGILRDVAGQRQAEERVRLLAHAVESSDELISVSDLEGRFTYANRAFLETYGYTSEELIGRHARLLDSPRNDPAVRQAIVTKAPRDGYAGILYNTRKDGSEFPVALRTSTVKDGAGSVIALVSVARDITHELESKEALERSEEHLRSILGGALDGVITIGPQALIESYNAAAERIFGHPPEKVLGRPVERLIPDLPSAMGVLPKVLEL